MEVTAQHSAGKFCFSTNKFHYFYVGLIFAFLACLASSTVGALELFRQLSITSTCLPFLPAAIICGILWLSSLVVSTLIFARSIRDYMIGEHSCLHSEQEQTRWQLIKYGFINFLSTMRAVSEASALYAATKAVRIPEPLCVFFALLNLLLEAILGKTEVSELILGQATPSVAHNSNKGCFRIHYHTALGLGMIGSFLVSCGSGWVAGSSLIYMIPIPILNYVVGGVIAAGFTIAGTIIFIQSVKELLDSCQAYDPKTKNRFQAIRCGLSYGISAYFAHQRQFFAQATATAYGLGSFLELYSAIFDCSALKQVPFELRVAIAGLGGLFNGLVRYIMNVGFFGRLFNNPGQKEAPCSNAESPFKTEVEISPSGPVEQQSNSATAEQSVKHPVTRLRVIANNKQHQKCLSPKPKQEQCGFSQSLRA